jgi:long-chain acyl-CoA synthetase
MELLIWGAQHGDRVHLVQGDTRLSFSELLAAVEQVSETLRGHGLGGGDRVMLSGATSLAWVVTFWACLSGGWVLVPANAWWSAEEAEHAVRLVGIRLAIADKRRRERLPAGLPCIELETIMPGNDVVGQRSATAQPGADTGPVGDSEDDPAMVLFTSGTTSFPRGATLSHRNLLGNLHNLLALAGRLPGTAKSTRNPGVTLMTMPLFHIGGIQQLFTALMSGGSLVFLDGRFSAEQVLGLIESEGITGWAAVPTMLSRVLDVVETAPSRYDVSSLRTMVIGGSQVAESLRTRARASFPRTAAKGLGASYGLTEIAGVAATAAGAAVAERPSTVGRPLPTVDVRIAAPDLDGVGEILVRSPGVMIGYWGSPDDPILTQDRWLHTGDLGWRDDDGYLYIVGRAKEVVIRGGENISTARVEERLLVHPAVSEVAVVGLPHAELGEELAAAVVLHAGARADEQELTRFARETLAYFAVPTVWRFAGDLPKNATGKVLKNQVAAQWHAGSEAL